MHDADYRLYAWHQYAAHQPSAGLLCPVWTGIHHIRHSEYLHLYRQRRFRIRLCCSITAYGVDFYGWYLGRYRAVRRPVLWRKYPSMEKVYRCLRAVAAGGKTRIIFNRNRSRFRLLFLLYARIGSTPYPKSRRASSSVVPIRRSKQALSARFFSHFSCGYAPYRRFTSAMRSSMSTGPFAMAMQSHSWISRS